MLAKLKNITIGIIILTFVFISSSSFIYNHKTEPELIWKAEIRPIGKLKKGDTAWVVLETDIPKNYHSYSNETSADVGPIVTQLDFGKKKKCILIGKDIIEGEKKEVYEEVFKSKFTEVRGHMVVKRQFKVTKKIIHFKVMTQICDDNICVMKEKEFELKVY